MEQEEDRLSNLPSSILHDILSRLPHKFAARTIVLSKAWAETWYTFPFLSFSDAKIIGKHPVEYCWRKRENLIESEDLLRKRKQFVDYVERTLLKFRDQRLAIKKFKLSMNCFDLHSLSKDVDLWLKLASERGVEVLKLWHSFDECDEEEEINVDQCYILPTGVFEAKSLTDLMLKGAIGVDLSFMNNKYSMKFFSLQILVLDGVLLGDEQAFQHFISCCPLIEYISLVWCRVLNPNPGGKCRRLDDSRNSRSRMMKSLCMCGLSRLKEVHIRWIQEVCVDSPCLENLCYCPGDRMDLPFKMDFNKCRNLRSLNLRSSLRNSIIITSQWFLVLFANFPFLESLTLQNCSMSDQGIHISSVQLKWLELSNCFKDKDVNIDAPNLLSCIYSSARVEKPVICFLRCSSQLKVSVSLRIKNLDFYNLREFIDNFKPQNVLASVSLCIHQPNIADALNPVFLQVSSRPTSIKLLDLCVVPEDKSLYLPLVYGLLSNCFPSTISIRLHCFSPNRAFIEFFYEMIMGGRKEDCFCIFDHTKCWWHDLKGVDVTSSMKIDKEVDFKTMLDMLQTSTLWEDISFRLKF